MCKPIFINDKKVKPFIELKEMRHPCLASKIPNFIPNDINIGIQNKENNTKTSLLITGPNMGGKSTVLRQTAIAVIMAQIGCYVPAKYFALTVVDRIFTRIGARDKILEGKSTFYVELEETKLIVEKATENSLVIIDELGRGTSTLEGQVIAKTILNNLEKNIKVTI